MTPIDREWRERDMTTYAMAIDEAEGHEWHETFCWAFREYRDLATAVHRTGSEDSPRNGKGDHPLIDYFDNVGDTLDERGIKLYQVPAFVTEAEEEWYDAVRRVHPNRGEEEVIYL